MSRDIWVISDTHFLHKNILTFRDGASGKLVRGDDFADVDEMNEHMIERWNSVVKQGDIVYHLGDVMMGDKDEFKKLWPRLNGSKRLIVGNHDDVKFLASGGFFQKISMWRMFPEFGLMFSHVPLHKSSLKRHWVSRRDHSLLGYWQQRFIHRHNSLLNVHGHIHQNPSPKGPYRNVSVEAINYTPVNIEELRIK